MSRKDLKKVSIETIFSFEKKVALIYLMNSVQTLEYSLNQLLSKPL
jgi:hypothetical protein